LNDKPPTDFDVSDLAIVALVPGSERHDRTAHLHRYRLRYVILGGHGGKPQPRILLTITGTKNDACYSFNDQVMNTMQYSTFRLAGILAFLILSGCSGRNVYRVAFSKVGTLAVGDAVLLSGVKAGKVSEMGLAGSSAIVSVQTDNVMQLRKDAVVRIVGVGLMGEKRIEIEQGKSGQFYAPGDTIQGASDAAVKSSPLQVLGELVDSLKSGIQAKLQDSIKILNARIDSLKHSAR